MIRQLLSCFLLLLFLFPLAEKEFHALEHGGDEHCAEHELMHLHEKEHDCTICDYTFEKTAEFSFVSFQIHFTTFFTSPIVYRSYLASKEFSFYSHRGPPALV